MTWYIEYSGEECGFKRLRIDVLAPVRIGRGTDSHTQIPDPALSRLHCEVELAENSPVVQDLGSSAGTFVGGQRIERRKMKAGEIFRAGNTDFRVVLESELDAPTQMVNRPPSEHALGEIIVKLDQAKIIDRFALTKLVNRSGTSLVYQAINEENGKTVAVKVIPVLQASDEDEARFLRALKMLQDMREPFIVRLYRAGRRLGFCWVAMEWFEAGSIAERIRTHGIAGQLSWKDAWRIANCMAQALLVLEREKIVHRNIRPTSILYRSKEDRWVLSDLVVAKALDATGNANVTQRIYLPSNLSYTAPERLMGEELLANSLQADIYSLGAILTEVLIGQPPYGTGSLTDILPRLKQPRNQVQDGAQLGISELFMDLVNKMTEPSRAKRISSAAELWQEVQRVGKLTGMQNVKLDG